jgi:hypothetical protein
MHEANGLRLHAKTTRPIWLGERLDLGYAIDLLHPPAQKASSRPTPRVDTSHRSAS